MTDYGWVGLSSWICHISLFRGWLMSLLGRSFRLRLGRAFCSITLGVPRASIVSIMVGALLPSRAKLQRFVDEFMDELEVELETVFHRLETSRAADVERVGSVEWLLELLEAPRLASHDVVVLVVEEIRVEEEHEEGHGAAADTTPQARRRIARHRQKSQRSTRACERASGRATKACAPPRGDEHGTHECIEGDAARIVKLAAHRASQPRIRRGQQRPHRRHQWAEQCKPAKELL